MKKLLLAFSLIAIINTSFAQLASRTWLVGGNGTFKTYNSTYTSSNSSQKSSYLQLSIFPNVGYFVLDRFAVGISPGFSWGKGQGGDVLDSNGNLIGSGGSNNDKWLYVGPFVRYYFLDSEKPFNILASASYQYGTYWSKPFTGSANNFGFSAGPVIYFNSSVGLELMVGYYYNTSDIESLYKTQEKGFQMSIGFQIHLEK